MINIGIGIFLWTPTQREDFVITMDISYGTTVSSIIQQSPFGSEPTVGHIFHWIWNCWVNIVIAKFILIYFPEIYRVYRRPIINNPHIHDINPAERRMEDILSPEDLWHFVTW